MPRWQPDTVPLSLVIKSVSRKYLRVAVPAGKSCQRTERGEVALQTKYISCGSVFRSDHVGHLIKEGFACGPGRYVRQNDVAYKLEYAHQNDAADNPFEYSADYYRGDLGVTFGGLTPSIGYESLGGDDSQPGGSFQTPLATLHAFNGWADQFLSTPGAGLNDLFLGLKGGLSNWTWNVIYHDFEAESGSQSYGDEIDASISRKFGEHYGLLLKAAFFDADSSSSYVDVTKLWVQFTADF